MAHTDPCISTSRPNISPRTTAYSVGSDAVNFGVHGVW